VSSPVSQQRGGKAGGELYIPPAPAPLQKGFGKFTRKMSSPKCANRIHSPLSVFYDPLCLPKSLWSREYRQVVLGPREIGDMGEMGEMGEMGDMDSIEDPPSLSATALTVPIASSRTLSRLRAACYPTGICELNCVTCSPSYQSILMH
jgi:hypothetical protein